MKKFFTLALALLVATVGFSQVQKQSFSRKGVKQNAATMQVAPRMDAVNEFAESEPTMTSTRDFSAGDLDFTTYDWQTNASIINRTIVWPDGKVNFAYTMSTDAAYSDRGTGIGTYDSNTDEWIPLEGRVENEKTGFGSIARYKENGIVVAAHTSNECGFYLLENKDDLAPNSLAPALRLDPTVDPCWPVVMTSGPNRDIIHIIATGYADSKLYYFRSSDGETWDMQNVVLPYLNEDFGSDWGSNVAYWMETTEDNCLALVVNNAWSDCMVIYSYDDGETWERKVFWHHPGINTTIDDWFFYPRWASCVWDANGKLCVAYEWNGSTGEPGSGSYYPGIGGVAFWSETMPYRGDGSSFAEWGSDPTNPMPPTHGQPFIMDTAYLFQDIYASWFLWTDATHEMWPEYFGYPNNWGENGEWEDPYADEWSSEWHIESTSDLSNHGSYNCGNTAMPTLCRVNDNEMVAVWVTLDDENSVDGFFFFKLVGAYSADNGMHWSHPINLVAGDFEYMETEFVFPQAAVIGNTLIVAVQNDYYPGCYVMDNDADYSDNQYKGFTFDITDLFSWYDGMPEVGNNHNVHMDIYPNPAVDQLNVTLSQNAEIVIYNIMGQKVMSQEGFAGANSINIDNLTSGIYFVNAGSDTQKFIVK